jgi:hypothetical protein
VVKPCGATDPSHRCGDYCFWPVACRHEHGAALNDASQPHGRALVPSAGPRCKAGRQNARPGGCPAAPRVLSRSCEDRRYLRCAIPRKLPRRDRRGEHPGPESRVGKGWGYVSSRGTRTRSNLIELKGGEAVRQIDFCDWGWGILARSGRYNAARFDGGCQSGRPEAVLASNARPERLECGSDED